MVLYPDAAAPVLQRKRQIVPPAAHLQVLRGDPLPELQHIRLPTAVVGVIVDNIVPIAMVVHVRVAAIAALKGIVSSSAHKNVVPILTVQFIVAALTLHLVVARTGVDRVIPAAGKEYLPAAVVLNLAKHLALIRSVGHRTGRYILRTPLRPVRKLNLVQLGVVAAEVVLYPDAAAPVLQRKRQIVPPAGHLQVLRGDPLSELQDIRLPIAVVGVIVDNIVSIAMVVHVCVAAIAALKGIVSSSAHKNVVAILAVQFIVAGTTR